MPIVELIRENNGIIDCKLIETKLPPGDLNFYITEC